MALNLLAKHSLYLRQHLVRIPAAHFSVDFLKLEMPALSPTMSEGTIVQWNIQEGGRVNVGDVICEIQTDKATIGFESQEEGYIAKILSQAGSVMPCGGLIGVMVEEEGDIANLDMSTLKATEAPAEPKKQAEKPLESMPAVSSPSLGGSDGDFLV